MSATISASTMPWQHVVGADIVGLVLFWLAAEWCVLTLFPRQSRHEEDADA